MSDATEYFLEKLREEGFDPMKFNLITDEFDKKYDFILCWAVLVHFKKDEAKVAIKKMYDALKDGGRLAISVKSRENASEGWEDYRGMIGAKRYFSFWTKDELAKFLEEIGLKNMRIDQWGGARACWLQCYGEK